MSLAEETIIKSNKRRKTTDDTRSSTLLLHEHVLRNVYSFLTFNEAFRMRRTCRQIHQNDIDIYQYSNIVKVMWETMLFSRRKRKYTHFQGLKDLYRKAEEGQNRALCNLGSIDKLRVVLRNENLSKEVAEKFILNLVQYSETDNVEALAFLIQDGRSSVSSTSILEMALRKNHTGMAALLQKQKAIQSEITVCDCSWRANNIACYKCVHEGQCRGVPYNVRWYDYGDLPHDYKPEMWCRECVANGGRNLFCAVCSECICQQCVQSRKYRCCYECHSMVCVSNGRFCGDECDSCGCSHYLCVTCITRTVAYEQEGAHLCRPCRSGRVFGPDQIPERD